MSQQFPHIYEHNEIVRVTDPAHPDHGETGEIWVIRRDTVAARNPHGEVAYTLSTKGGKTIHAYERQIMRA